MSAGLPHHTIEQETARMRTFIGETVVPFLLGLRAAVGGIRPRLVPGRPRRGTFLGELTWAEAERVLTPESVVVVPLGAQAKEHGHHLPLQNDWLLAEYLKERVLEAIDVVVAPTLNYGFYPAFLEYPGSSSLSRATARDMIVEICRGWSQHGPRRFYVLNTGISPLLPLGDAAAILAEEGILLRFSDETVLEGVETAAAWEQRGGTHADEVETSIMLHIAPDAVTMARAVPDCRPHRPGPLTRDPRGTGTYSPSGVWGDPTRATRAKGRAAVGALLAGIFRQIELVRVEPLPVLGSPSECRAA
jgi:creatinine amidohydrolase